MIPSGGYPGWGGAAPRGGFWSSSYSCPSTLARAKLADPSGDARARTARLHAVGCSSGGAAVTARDHLRFTRGAGQFSDFAFSAPQRRRICWAPSAGAERLRGGVRRRWLRWSGRRFPGVRGLLRTLGPRRSAGQNFRFAFSGPQRRRISWAPSAGLVRRLGAVAVVAVVGASGVSLGPGPFCTLGPTRSAGQISVLPGWHSLRLAAVSWTPPRGFGAVLARRPPSGLVGVPVGGSWVRRGLPPVPHVRPRFTRSAGPDPISGFSGRLSLLIPPGRPGQAGQASGWGAGGGGCSWERRGLPLMSHVSLRFTRSAVKISNFGVSGRLTPAIGIGSLGPAPSGSTARPCEIRDSAVSRATTG